MKRRKRRLRSATGVRLTLILGSAVQGAAAGLAGTAVMTLGEKLEQALTGRPNSYVPGRTLRALLGRPVSDRAKPAAANSAMHWGTGAALGAVRGIWAITGIRGGVANATHTVVRLAFDQTLENATGTGAPPTLWPVGEKTVDYLHKAIYSIVTGAAADRWIAPRLISRRGVRSH
ncbi:hypothetical protein ACX80W_04290 [Arthrobacter sp. TMN-37]